MTGEYSKKDIERTNALEIPTSYTNPFGNNVSAEKAYRRAERIVAAFYLLTKHVPDSEPVKHLARQTGHALLKDIVTLRSGFRIESGASKILDVYAHVKEMISMARLLVVGGFISKENAELVARALEELTQFIESARGTELSEETILSKDDLLMDHAGRAYATRTKRDVAPAPYAPAGVSEDNKQSREQKISRDPNSGRRGAILDVLKGGRKMAIRDIASFVVGCSEKTVQRELAGLISEGLVRKEGKKRWSRYSLV